VAARDLKFIVSPVVGVICCKHTPASRITLLIVELKAPALDAADETLALHKLPTLEGGSGAALPLSPYLSRHTCYGNWGALTSLS
jgi:hypothetical protein